METAVVAVAIVVSVCTSLYLFALSQVSFLKKNWPKYRCHPLYMPMAGMVGQDVATNFTKCTMKGFQDYGGFVMDPIMSQFSLFNSVIGDISGAMNDMRGMMSDTRNGFLGIVGTVFGKIENLMSQFQYIIIRMRTLLARVVGIMMSFMYIFYGGMQTGESVVAGPIGKTMSVLCFDPQTQMEMNDGTFKAMKDLVLGDILKDNNKVTSTYTINGQGVPMYLLDNIKVSGAHKVLYNGNFIPVSEHFRAIKCSEGIPMLSCINTEAGSFKIGEFRFMNFTETGDISGHHVSTTIPLKTGYTSISKVKIGDVLYNNDVVVGTVRHLNNDTECYNLITNSGKFDALINKMVLDTFDDEIGTRN